MENNIVLTGKIIFDPPNKTKKHENQSEWKRTAFIEFDGDLCAYYAWFIKTRYSIKLNTSFRKPHITFISDKFTDIKGNNDGEKELLWCEIKKKYHKTEIKIVLDVDVRTNGYFWWFNVPEKDRVGIHNIRHELGLDRPYFGLHMTIGKAFDLNLEQSKYIHETIQNKLLRNTFKTKGL